MKGSIFLYGEIINEQDSLASAFGYINLSNVQSQVSALGEDVKEIDIHISSVGGSVDGGEKIHSYLLGLKDKGYKLNTHTSGTVCSMGTYLFMIGDERIAYKGDSFIPHMPLVSDYTGRADELEDTAKELRALEVKFSKYYALNTNLNESQAKTLLEKDEELDLEEALALGFITELKNKREIIAKITNMNFKEAIKNLVGATDKTDVKAVTLTLTSGAMVESNSESTEPAVGDVWQVEGENAPDGEHVTEDGYTVTTENGIVTAVTQQEEVVEEVAKTEEEVLAEMTEIFESLFEAKISAKNKELEDLREDLKGTKSILAETLKEVEGIKAVSSLDIDTEKVEATAPKTITNRFAPKQK